MVNIYVIYDLKADVYSLPIIYNHDEEFKRAVIGLCLKEENALSFVCDNVYYKIGEYDIEQGLICSIDALKVFSGKDIEREVYQLKAKQKELEESVNESNKD